MTTISRTMIPFNGCTTALDEKKVSPLLSALSWDIATLDNMYVDQNQNNNNKSNDTSSIGVMYGYEGYPYDSKLNTVPQKANISMDNNRISGSLKQNYLRPDNCNYPTLNWSKNYQGSSKLF